LRERPAKATNVPAPPPRRSAPHIYDETQKFWLVSLIQVLSLAVVSYFVAAFTFLVLKHISDLPTGALWSESSFRATLLFVMLGLAVGLLSVPYFQKDWGSGARTLSLFSATFLIAYTVFQATGFVDPSIPLEALTQYVVEPLRQKFGF